MKKLFLLFVVTLVLTSFTNNKTKTASTHYAFVTDTEHDKSFDEYGQNGYVSITTNIVEVNCSLGINAVELQYIQHYNGQEKSENRQRAFIGPFLKLNFRSSHKNSHNSLPKNFMSFLFLIYSKINYFTCKTRNKIINFKFNLSPGNLSRDHFIHFIFF